VRPPEAVADAASAARGRGVGQRYATATGEVVALDAVDVDVAPGHITVAAGPSGSGKSTLLRLVAGLDTPTSGRIWVGDDELTALSARARRRLRRERIAFVWQSPADNLLGYLTVREQLELAAGLRGVAPDDALEVLELLGLGDRLDDLPDHLSGGEQQRVALACAAVGSSALLVADEPTAQLDVGSTHTVLDALDALRARGTTVLLSSHDPEVLERADHLIRLDHGRLVGA